MSATKQERPLLNCQHTISRFDGKGSSFCEACGVKTMATDSRECQHCAHFKDLGPTQDNHCICTHHLMGVTRTMHVSYDPAKGSCFKESADTLFEQCVVRKAGKHGDIEINCRLGLWGVSGGNRATVEAEARHYWVQYFGDGEYAALLANQTPHA